MVNVTISVPEDLKKTMDTYAIINWSEVARKAFAEQIHQLELLKTLTSKSKATDEDIHFFSEKIKRAVSKRHEG